MDYGRTFDRQYPQYRFPKKTYIARVVSFQDKTAFHNPYMDLCSCFGKGLSGKKQEQLIFHLFKDAREKMQL